MKQSSLQALLLTSWLWRQSGRYYASDMLLQEDEQQQVLTKKAIGTFKQSAAISQYVVRHHLEGESAGYTTR